MKHGLPDSMSRADREHLINTWIFDEKARKALKRRLLDGITYEALAEEFDMSVRGMKKLIYRATDKLSKHMK
ncbi:MAG: sigma-70 family RNA polymerase sigma factor [Lachnospiraceae bacterium]|nr:sigma-70 family RNA polymerase sigma factor [Lachnospiraceae bacterium]